MSWPVPLAASAGPLGPALIGLLGVVVGAGINLGAQFVLAERAVDLGAGRHRLHAATVERRREQMGRSALVGLEIDAVAARAPW